MDWRGPVLIPALVFLAFAWLFVMLRSNDTFAVDGSSRCLDVYRRGTLFFHPNNHLLYPANVLAWTRMAAVLGMKPDGPIEYFALVEVMNCLAGAGALGILSFLMYQATSSWSWAIAGTAGYGLSKGFLESATNPNEPMVGLFWSFLAVLAASASFKVKSNWPATVSGLLFSLAMASYQTMILLAPAAILLLWRGGSVEERAGAAAPRRYSRIGVFALSGVASSALIYGWAYWRSGTQGLAAMIQRFFRHEDARAYLGVSVERAVSVPIGMVRNIFPVLVHFRSVHEALAEQKLQLVVLFLVLLAFCAFLGYCIARLAGNWSELSQARKTAVVAASAGFLFSCAPLFIWFSNYDKFWLQPLACLAFFLVIALGATPREARRPSLVFRAAPALLLAGVLTNITWAVPAHTRPNTEFEESRRLAGLIGPDDLLVGDWDNVSGAYGAVWARDGHMISFPYDAVLYGKEATSRLREAILKTKEKGGRVYFLSVLDITERAWNLFLAPKCGVPYSDLDSYRLHSKVIARFEGRDGPVALRQLDLASFE
ncbi:MAG TPA: hypothetical protein VKG84_08135 [Candidatus Acidoferrales bacterium]|nr:hypothetical protein [Candidatus Acidoferrales bacterium]